MKTLNSFLMCVAIVCLCGTESAAQGLTPSGYFTYGAIQLNAGQSFEAVLGSSSHPGFGVGGRVDGLWRGLFVDLGFSQQRLSGERVFVIEETIFPLGIDTTITYRPFDVAAGWQFRLDRVRPYIGAGMTALSFRETSDFAQAGDDVSEQKTGPMLLAGVDVSLLRYLRTGGEIRYRSIQGILGRGGVSQQFGEDELGGFAFAARVSIGR